MFPALKHHEAKIKCYVESTDVITLFREFLSVIVTNTQRPPFL